MEDIKGKTEVENLQTYRQKNKQAKYKKQNTVKSIIDRILAVIIYAREELLTIIKDPAILLVFVIANIIYPIIYSIAYEPNQIKNVSIALIDNDNTAVSRQLSRMIDATEGIQVTYKPTSLDKAKDLFYTSKVHGIVSFPENFEKDILSGKQTTISLYADASYFLIYRQVYSSTVYAYRQYAAGIQVKKGLMHGKNLAMAISAINPVNFKTVELYNPNASYGAFVMPPLILIILQQTLLIGIGILGGTRKEIHRYNFMLPADKHSKRVMPFILGKAFAYFTVFMIIGTFTLVWVHHWYVYPNKASYLEVLSLYVPYITANVFLGMTISVFFKRRENALLFMVFLSVPVLFLSGATWPVEAIPPFLHKMSYIFPSAFMVPAYLRVRSMGAELHHVSTEIYAMLIQCVIYSIMAYAAFRHIMKQMRENTENNTSLN